MVVAEAAAVVELIEHGAGMVVADVRLAVCAAADDEDEQLGVRILAVQSLPPLHFPLAAGSTWLVEPGSDCAVGTFAVAVPADARTAVVLEVLDAATVLD